jgi:hypothetical protein
MEGRFRVYIRYQTEVVVQLPNGQPGTTPSTYSFQKAAPFIGGSLFDYTENRLLPTLRAAKNR